MNMKEEQQSVNELSRKELAEKQDNNALFSIVLDGKISQEYPSEDTYVIHKFDNDDITRKELAQMANDESVEGIISQLLLNANVDDSVVQSLEK
jgi:hypothetical protein